VRRSPADAVAPGQASLAEDDLGPTCTCRHGETDEGDRGKRGESSNSHHLSVGILGRRWRTLAQARNSFLDHTEADSKEAASVKAPRLLLVSAVLAATAAIGFSIGRVTTATAAEASATHRYTLRVGDTMTVPAVGQRCAVYIEGGAPELFCARPRHARHQVTVFRDSISVWKVGNPDRPAWSGKP
jgi:hypothetical protein